MRYEPASAQPTASGCQPATHALGVSVSVVFPDLESLHGPYGCWNPRRIEGSSAWSLHAEGRALDIGVPAAAGKDAGWELACALVGERLVLGTMRVIWDGHIWSAERLDRWRQLDADLNQHHDHVHVEQWWKDALRKAEVVQPQYTAALRKARRNWPTAS